MLPRSQLALKRRCHGDKEDTRMEAPAELNVYRAISFSEPKGYAERILVHVSTADSEKRDGKGRGGKGRRDGAYLPAPYLHAYTYSRPSLYRLISHLRSRPAGRRTRLLETLARNYRATPIFGLKGRIRGRTSVVHPVPRESYTLANGDPRTILVPLRTN